MPEHIISFLKDILLKESVTVMVAAWPLAELRGAMPLGVAMGLSLKKAFILSVFGNMLPIVPLLYFLEPVSDKMRKFRPWRKFFKWFFDKRRKKARNLEKIEAFWLMLFVAAVPIPGAGVWTGCVLASLFEVRLRYAAPAAALGVVIAGIVVAAFIYLGKIII